MSEPTPTPATAGEDVTGKFGIHHDHLVFMGDDCNCDTPDPAIYGHRAGCGDVPVMTIDELPTVLAHAGLIIAPAAHSVTGTAAPTPSDDFHVGDIVRNKKTRDELTVTATGYWQARFYELVECPHTPAGSGTAALTEDPELINVAQRMAAALALAIHDGHPAYGNTTGWRGGIGGQAITQGCSFIDPPPGVEYTQHDLLSTPLREFLTAHPFDLNQVKAALREELEAQLHGPLAGDGDE